LRLVDSYLAGAFFGMGSKSRESIFGPSIRASAERAAAARKE